MCDCLDCGRVARCDNPGCTNDLCPDCEAQRHQWAEQWTCFEIRFKPQPLVAPGHVEVWTRYAKDLRAAILEVVDEFAASHPHGLILSVAAVPDEARA